MNILKKENKLCLSCMEYHDLSTVEVPERNIFKDKEVQYNAIYYYCDKADEYYASEEMMSKNDISMKDAYRRQNNLLTSFQINELRRQYGISQSDLAIILGWGEKTITRYEGHQVQDFAHDTILKKIVSDPEWYLELLKSAKEKLSLSSYKKYYETALQYYASKQDEYLRKVIQAAYAEYEDFEQCTGGKPLDLNKVVDVVRYFANSTKTKFLYKVKLMKMLWYTDALSYKNNGISMTGLVYKALPMGAVPISHEHIIDLHGITYEEVSFDESTAYHFIGDNNNDYPAITENDKKILDYIIEKFGDAHKKTIVDAMHKEIAYIETAPNDIIQYKYAKGLSI